jgi:hypothetical protein
MHASSDIRIVKCLDGLHYSFEILEYIYTSLHEVRSRVQVDHSSLIPALWRCWSFVDVVHRIREVAQALPGLSKKDKELVAFLDAPALAEEFRHSIQHLRSELSKKDVNPFPVWGSLAWVDPTNPARSYLVVIGARINGTSYTGCVFDMVERKWVSKVCLGVSGKSFNFDPIYEACLRFRDFVVPWALSTYKPDIQMTAELPIITIELLVSSQALPSP